jgi:hypothetical protein
MSNVEMLAVTKGKYRQDDIQPKVLKILEPENEILQDLVDQFTQTRTQANETQVACLFELKSTDVGNIVGGTDRTVGRVRTVRMPK